MFRQALAYTHSGPDTETTVIRGSLVTVFGLAVLWLGLLAGVVLVPMILLAGYAARIIEESLYDDAGAPVFRTGATMAYEGVKTATVAGVYLAIPLVVAGGTALRTGSLTSGVGRFGLLAAALLAVPWWYVDAAGVVNFVRMGRVAEALWYRRFDHVVTSRAYARHWLAALELVAAGGLVGAVLVQVPLAVGGIPLGVVPAASCSTPSSGRRTSTPPGSPRRGPPRRRPRWRPPRPPARPATSPTLRDRPTATTPRDPPHSVRSRRSLTARRSPPFFRPYKSAMTPGRVSASASRRTVASARGSGSGPPS